MSKTGQLKVLEKMSLAGGARFTRTALTFETVDESSLREVGEYLQTISACVAWWWGDYLAAWCGYELTKDQVKAGTSFDELEKVERLKQYTGRYALICDRDSKTLWHWRSVAEFYNSSRRREELTWSHHLEAKEGSDGDKAVADNWLDLAEQHKWSVQALRAAIRKHKREADGETDEPEPQLLLPVEVVNCTRWASATLTRVEDMDIEEAKALLAELETTLRLATALSRKVLSGGQKLPICSDFPQADFAHRKNLPTQGGKESLQPAA